MELLAAKKKSLNKQIECSQITNKKNDEPNKKDCIISLRINTLLYNTLHNYLSAMHNVADYTFSSISDILRHVILKIEKGELPTKEATISNDKTYIEITIRVSEQQKKFWTSLPIRLKRTIMEKAIVAFLQQNK